MLICATVYDKGETQNFAICQIWNFDLTYSMASTSIPFFQYHAEQRSVYKQYRQ